MQHKLKELRKEFNLKQHDVYEDICSRNSYYRFENNIQDIPFDLLDQFLKRIGIPFSQYLQFLDDYETENIYENIESHFMDLINKSEEEQQNFLNHEFQMIQNNRFKNLYALHVYIQIKSVVRDYLKVSVSPLTKLDLKEVEEFYQNRTKIFPTDFAILANITYNFSCEELQQLESLIIKNMDISSLPLSTFKKLAAIYANFITLAIRENNVSYAEHYYQKLSHVLTYKVNYYLKIQSLYFQNMIDFMKTNDIFYLKRALDVINLISNLDDPLTCDSLRQEVNQLLKIKNIQIPDELFVVGSEKPHYPVTFE